jgi:hypothetical protein
VTWKVVAEREGTKHSLQGTHFIDLFYSSLYCMPP